MNTTVVYVEIENHPYAALVVLLLFLFMIGIITSFFTNVWGGVQFVGKIGYFATAPVHMPVKWAYRKITRV